jgi:parvulin-like peptidyl-prolyl isomerase
MAKPNLLRIFLFLSFIAYFNSMVMIKLSFAGDKIVAIINSDTVTKRELNDFANFMRMQLSREYGGKELEKKLQSLNEDLLNRLIEDRLILQEAKKTKLEVDPGRVKAKIADIKKRYASDVEFQQDLVNQGLTQADIEKKIKEQLLMFAAVEKKVRDKIIVSPEEVTNFYYKNINEFKSPEERELDVFTLENANLSETFSYNLRIGKKLEELAERYPFTASNLKTSSNEELRKEIKDVVQKMGLNEISSPVKMDDKYYVFRLKAIVAPKQEYLSEAKEKIYNFLFEQKMQQELAKWLAELKKQSYIKIIE